MWINELSYRYVLELPCIMFIYILSYLNKINKKIMCFIVPRSGEAQDLILLNPVGRKRPPGGKALRANRVKNIFLPGWGCPRVTRGLEKKLLTIKGVNQQETLLSNLEGSTNFVKQRTHNTSYNNSKGSSETTCDITYNFYEYLNLIPQHKKKINRNFLEWFIGFTEGDGSFIISKNKVYFDITKNLNDIQVLYYIKKELGFGKVLIRSEKDRNVGVFYVSSKENFTRLIAIFNGNLSTNSKKKQFRVWLDTYNNQYDMKITFKDMLVKPSLFSGWISGFAEANVFFYGRREKDCLTSKLKRAPHLTFKISHQEIHIIKTLRDIFLLKESSVASSARFVSYEALSQRSLSAPPEVETSRLKNINYDKSWDGWSFHCSSFTKLKVIRNYFARYKLKTRKSLAFFKWCKLHDMVLNKDHLTLEGLNKIDLLTKDINKFMS
jgi:hypothetical protein